MSKPTFPGKNINKGGPQSPSVYPKKATGQMTRPPKNPVGKMTVPKRTSGSMKRPG